MKPERREHERLRIVANAIARNLEQKKRLERNLRASNGRYEQDLFQRRISKVSSLLRRLDGLLEL